MFCARAVACCGNRALTPKEIAAIASRKWNWACSGTQPFAVISSCIRAHLRRAEKAKPPYPAMFRSYELTSVPPPEDIPCLGIEPEARPVVKRGTFWFLTEAMGFQSPFQHRLGEEILGSNVGGKEGTDGKGQATLSATSSGASLGNNDSVAEGTAPSALTASLLAQGQSSMTKTANEEKPLTRAQKAQLGTGAPATPAVFQHQLIAPAPAPAPALAPASGTVPLATATPAAGPPGRKEGPAVDTLGRGKRKRTASQAVNKLSTPGAKQTLLPPSAAGPVVGGTLSPQAGSSTPTSAVVSATASSAPQARDVGAHRRALSSSASSASDATKPSFSGFRKLKFRLSALSELPSPNASPSIKKTASAPRVTGPCPPAASAQPLSKRQRTQSMSQLSSSTSFPFDNLLHGLSSSLHSHHDAGHRLHTHTVPPPLGTIHPLDIHNLHISSASSLHPAASPHHFDSLASRSAPDSNIFSPPVQSTSHVSGPFSRSHSPSSYFHKIRSANTAESDAPSPASYAGEAESVTPYSGVDMMDLSREYDGWSAGHRSLTDSAILAAQQELTGAATSNVREAQHLSDYHEAMLKSDLDLDFDFSLNSLRESSVIKQDIADSAQEGLSTGVSVTAATPDEAEKEEESFQMDVGDASTADLELDGVFDGLSPGGAEGAEDSAMAEVITAHSPLAEEEFEEDEDEEVEGSEILPGLGARRSKSLAESIARHRALSTTLCPAAGKTRADSSKSVRPIARRINSVSNLVFPKLSVSGEGLSTPRLRPNTIFRTNSRDVLSTPVPLAELPSIPLLSNDDLVYNLHSDADAHHEDAARFSEDGDSRAASTPNIKAEEEDAENAFDVDGDEASSLLPPAARSASTSRSSSVESATDPFRPEAYVRAASMTSSSATAINEGALEATAIRSIPRSRSQSSSRRTSLSPRDSFSPQASGPHADWALTPPSEEEAMMEDEEKNLDRATLLGPESVDVEEFDDVWPYSFGEFRQRLNEGVSDTDEAEAAQQVESTPTATAADQQLSCSTPGAGIFEPILAAAPLPPQAEAAPAFSHASTSSLTEPSATGDAMAVDEQPARPRSRTVTTNLPPNFMRSNGKVRNASEGRVSSTPSPITSGLPTHRPIWPAPANSTSLPHQKGLSARLSAADSGTASAPAATQSFLFQPEAPFDPPINILLTEKKVLFYQTCVAGSSSSLATFPMPFLPRGLLRRVDNDAVEVDALMAICAAADPEMKDTCMEKVQQVKADGNTWVDIVAAREIVAACGRGSQLDDFLADDILLAWNDKLQKLGVWLRSKNGLKFPVGSAGGAAAFTRSSSSACPSPPTPTAASAVLPADKVPASASRPRAVQPSISPRVRSRKVSSSLVTAPVVEVDAAAVPAEMAESSKLDTSRSSHPSLPAAKSDTALAADSNSPVQPVKAAPKTPKAGTGKTPPSASSNTPGAASASTRRSARNKSAA